MTTDLLTFTLPQEWRSNVTISTGDSSGVPTAAVCPTEQPDFPPVSFTVERADAPLIDGDAATYRAASWSNGNGQRIDMWCYNPAVLLWSSQNAGTQDPFTTPQAVEQAIYLESGGRFTPGAVVDAPSDVDAATMGAYGQLSIEPTVLVPFYRDGNPEGTAGPEAGVTWSDDVRRPVRPGARNPRHSRGARIRRTACRRAAARRARNSQRARATGRTYGAGRTDARTRATGGGGGRPRARDTC